MPGKVAGSPPRMPLHHIHWSFDDDLPRHVGVWFAEIVVGPGPLELKRELVFWMQGLGVEERRRCHTGTQRSLAVITNCNARMVKATTAQSTPISAISPCLEFGVARANTASG